MKQILMRTCEQCGVSIYESERDNLEGMCFTCHDEYFKEAINKGVAKKASEIMKEVINV